jgi:hypothetical protein
MLKISYHLILMLLSFVIGALSYPVLAQSPGQSSTPKSVDFDQVIKGALNVPINQLKLFNTDTAVKYPDGGNTLGEKTIAGGGTLADVPIGIFKDASFLKNKSLLSLPNGQNLANYPLINYEPFKTVPLQNFVNNIPGIGNQQVNTGYFFKGSSTVAGLAKQYGNSPLPVEIQQHLTIKDVGLDKAGFSDIAKTPGVGGYSLQEAIPGGGNLTAGDILLKDNFHIPTGPNIQVPLFDLTEGLLGPGAAKNSETGSNEEPASPCVDSKCDHIILRYPDRSNNINQSIQVVRDGTSMKNGGHGWLGKLINNKELPGWEVLGAYNVTPGEPNSKFIATKLDERKGTFLLNISFSLPCFSLWLSSEVQCSSVFVGPFSLMEMKIGDALPPMKSSYNGIAQNLVPSALTSPLSSAIPSTMPSVSSALNSAGIDPGSNQSFAAIFGTNTKSGAFNPALNITNGNG